MECEAFRDCPLPPKPMLVAAGGHVGPSSPDLVERIRGAADVRGLSMVECMGSNEGLASYEEDNDFG